MRKQMRAATAALAATLALGRCGCGCGSTLAAGLLRACAVRRQPPYWLRLTLPACSARAYLTVKLALVAFSSVVVTEARILLCAHFPESTVVAHR